MVESDGSKDPWKDKYLKICEKTIANPVKDCITGALVSHLNTNLSPVIVKNKNESPTAITDKMFEQFDEGIHKQNSLDSKLRRKNVIRTSNKESEEVINKRKQSYIAGLEKENLEKLRLEYDKNNIIEPIVEEENIYEEVYGDLTEDPSSELYLVPLNSFRRTSKYLAEHSKTWPRQIARPKINSNSSLPDLPDQNKRYVSFDSDVKNLIKKLLVTIQQETMDEDSLIYLEELKRYTEGTSNTEKKKTTIKRKFCLERQSEVIEEEIIEDDSIYVEMVDLDYSSIESETTDELLYSVPIKVISKSTVNVVAPTNLNLNKPELLNRKLSNTPIYAVPKFADPFYTAETNEFSNSPEELEHSKYKKNDYDSLDSVKSTNIPVDRFDSMKINTDDVWNNNNNSNKGDTSRTSPKQSSSTSQLEFCPIRKKSDASTNFELEERFSKRLQMISKDFNSSLEGENRSSDKVISLQSCI